MKKLRKMACVLLCLAFLMTAGTAWGQEEGEGYSIIVDNMELRMGESMRYTLRDLAVEIQIGENSKQGSGWGALKSGEEDLFRIFLDYGESHSRVWLDGLDFYFDGQNDAELNELFYQLNGMEWTPEEEGVREELNFQEALEIDQRIAAIGQADLAQIYRGSVEYGAEHGLGITPQGETTVEINGQERSVTHYKVDQSPEDVRKRYEEYDSKHPECNDYMDFAQNILNMVAGGQGASMTREDVYEQSDFTVTGDDYLAQDGSVMCQNHVSVSAREGHEKDMPDYEYDVQTVIADGWIEAEFQQEGVQTRIKLPLKPGEGMDGAVCELNTEPMEIEIEHNMEGADWASEIKLVTNVRVEYEERDGQGRFTTFCEVTPIFPEEVEERIAEERSGLTGLEQFTKTETEQYKEIFSVVMGEQQSIQVEFDLEQNRADIEIEDTSGGQKMAMTMEANFREIGFEDIQQPDWSSLEAITLENAEDKQEEWDEAFSKWSEEVAGKMAQNDALSLFMPEVIDTEELP